MNKPSIGIGAVILFFSIVGIGYGADETKKEVSTSKIIRSGGRNEKTADVLMDEATKAAAQKESTTSKIIPSSDHVQKKEEAPIDKTATTKKENAPLNSPSTTKTENTVKSAQKQTAVTTTKTTTTTTAKGAAAQSNP